MSAIVAPCSSRARASGTAGSQTCSSWFWIDVSVKRCIPAHTAVVGGLRDAASAPECVDHALEDARHRGEHLVDAAHEEHAALLRERERMLRRQHVPPLLVALEVAGRCEP